MTAKNPGRRTKTARELAERWGASDRTIRRIIAEPRAEYESRAAAKRQRAQELRAAGATYRQIAEDLGVKTSSVAALLRTPVSVAG